MLRLNGCRRCHGDLVIEKDEYGWYEKCIQCGYLHDITAEKIPVAVKPVPQVRILVAPGMRK
jgi:hypothetical protein